MKKKKLWTIIAVVVALLATGFYFVTNGKDDKVTYRFDKVDRGDIVVSISATGTLNADTTVLVGSQVSGRIAKLYADFNSVVKRGQLLAQLDPTFLQAAVDQAKAGVSRSRATLNQAERDFNRTKDLFDKNLVSQADMDAALTSLESAKAGMQQSEAAFEGADVNLRYATITSPISGVVISRSVDVGQTVAASLSAPTLFTIANDLRKMQVQASVDEADIGNVKVSQRVTFRVDSYPENQFEGVVSQVRLSPVITQNVVNYTVIISVGNPDLKLMPGMTATVSIEVDKREDVLRIPVQAIRFTPPDEPKEVAVRDTTRMRAMGDRKPSDSSRAERRRRMGAGANHARVWLMENDELKSVPIIRGLMNTQYVEVVESPLKEGDQVIIGSIGGQTATASAAQNNPFQPRIQGGGGGGGGRRGF